MMPLSRQSKTINKKGERVMMPWLVLLLLLSGVLCHGADPAREGVSMTYLHGATRPQDVLVTHLDVDWVHRWGARTLMLGSTTTPIPETPHAVELTHSCVLHMPWCHAPLMRWHVVLSHQDSTWIWHQWSVGLFRLNSTSLCTTQRCIFLDAPTLTHHIDVGCISNSRGTVSLRHHDALSFHVAGHSPVVINAPQHPVHVTAWNEDRRGGMRLLMDWTPSHKRCNTAQLHTHPQAWPLRAPWSWNGTHVSMTATLRELVKWHSASLASRVAAVPHSWNNFKGSLIVAGGRQDVVYSYQMDHQELTYQRK